MTSLYGSTKGKMASNGAIIIGYTIEQLLKALKHLWEVKKECADIDLKDKLLGVISSAMIIYDDLSYQGKITTGIAMEYDGHVTGVFKDSSFYTANIFDKLNKKIES